MSHFLRQIGQKSQQQGEIVFRCPAERDGVSIGLHRKQTDAFYHYSPMFSRKLFKLKQRKTQMIHFGKRCGFHFSGHFLTETAAAAVEDPFLLEIKYCHLTKTVIITPKTQSPDYHRYYGDNKQ